MLKKTLLKALVVALLAATVIACLCVVPAAAAETQYVTYRKSKAGLGASTAYSNSKFYRQLTNVPLTGDNATDVLAIALSQLGYLEGASTADLGGTSSGSRNDYTEMCRNTGSGSGYYWCAAFCSFSLWQARASDQNGTDDFAQYNQGNGNYIWCGISCTNWANNLTTAGVFKKSKYDGGSYTPKTGDLIFFKASDWGASHIGLIAYTDDKYVYTIEGNTNDGTGVVSNGIGVYFKKYTLDSSRIYGYGALSAKYKSNNSDVKVDFSGKNPTPGIYVNAYHNDKYLYADESCSSANALTTVPFNAQVEVTDVIAKYTPTTNNSDDEENLSLLKVKYTDAAGKTYEGYMKDNEYVRLIQISKAEHTHDYTNELVNDKYMINDATCTTKATYYKSCSCGLAGTETFTVGEVNPDNHTNVEFVYISNGDGTHSVKYACCAKVKDAAVLCSGGNKTCTEYAKCKLCEADYGDAPTHSFTISQNNTTQHWNKCENCDEISEKQNHSYDAEGKCICGDTQPVAAPGEENTTPSLPAAPGFNFDVGDKLPVDAEVLAKPIDVKSEEGKTILEKVEGYGYNKKKDVVIYDIHALSQGVKIQPNGMIAVTLEKPIDNVDNYVIYHMKDDGSIEIINTDVKDGNVSFEISSFSNFVFAERVDSIPGNGLSLGAIIGIVLAILIPTELIIFAIVWFVIKKKSFTDLFR